MLTIYTRHKEGCAHAAKGRKYHKCGCPLWAQGTLPLDGPVRKSLDTGDWQAAQQTAREWECEKTCKPKVVVVAEPTGIEEAREKFMADAKQRNLAGSTIYKYETLFRQLKAFSERKGLRYLPELDLDLLTSFRAEWKDGPRASGKKLERLRAFFSFCVARKWLTESPVAVLKPPKVKQRPVVPFTNEQMISILAACDEYGRIAAHSAKLNAVRLRSLVLLMRYSGLRISDAVGLDIGKLDGDRLMLYTAKTGTPVYCVLPDFVVSALASMPRVTEQHPFWTGAGSLVTCVKVWETRLRRLFQLAGIPGGHGHQLRHTFARGLLEGGVPIKRVSVLLGHTNTTITERVYLSWVQSHQEQTEADLRDAWAADPVANLLSTGTPQVQGAQPLPN